MGHIELSKRLRQIAEEVPHQANIADIGTDHGHLPIQLVKEGRVAWALAADVNEEPLQTAITRIKKENLESMIKTRKGNGLQVIQENDPVDTVIVAGMGGSLITEILKEGFSILPRIKRLILQPNIHAVVIRKWLALNKWELVKEHIVEEDSRVYEILVAERGEGDRPYKNLTVHEEAGYLFGPYLLKEKSAVFLKKWKREEQTWLRILKELEKATTLHDIEEKKIELQNKLTLLKEVLKNESS